MNTLNIPTSQLIFARKQAPNTPSNNPLCIPYFLTKETKDRHKVNWAINSILDVFHVIPITEKILRIAIKSEITDYEDAVIESSGLEKEIDFIITRDKNDFKKSKIPSLTPKQFLEIK